ncbi:hypothetical protein PCC7424_3873 [Gloeothece citriformis PCC 7424]|uniref:Mobilization protein n=1 Tax=Gloeothece citriformis (strain PCC 7424) TaxID=65393 RepID=B7KKB9_GLOC7|nr:hypothetical protein [Gloeothece citriformis]ACK72252.1 hypothetical protein PCC7424_3873 [Gloeothece citriformis PCC 7424]
MKQKQSRTCVVSVRFLPKEKQHLTERAVQQQTTVSELLRLNVLTQNDKSRHKSVPEVNRRLYFELEKISEQLQTIEPSTDSLTKLQNLLDEVRKELLGMNK